MAEDTTAAAAADGAQTAADTTTTTTATAGTVLAQDHVADDTAATTTGDTATEWRSAYGEDKEIQKLLARLSSHEDVGKKLLNQEKAIRSGPRVPSLPENAAPEEVAAYRKAIGVPDKPEGYGFTFPAEAGASEADTAALGDFQAFMHERHVPPGAAKAAFEYYVKRMTEGRAAQAEAAERATLENMTQLRAEFKGREFQRSKKIADEFLMQHFGEDPESLTALNEVLTMRLPNGVQVMHYAPFMKGLFNMARSHADEDALVAGDGAGGGKSLDDEITELIGKSVAKKLTASEDKRLNDLYAARIARDEKRGRAA